MGVALLIVGRREMSTISLEEAQARLPALIDQLSSGESIIITRNQLPVAQLTPVANGVGIPLAGRCRGMLTILAEDEEHLADFGDYLP
jgi:antitoxin (DNA-binding transcriptional repressor) of toxin-antitoxin stability system